MDRRRSAVRGSVLLLAVIGVVGVPLGLAASVPGERPQSGRTSAASVDVAADAYGRLPLAFEPNVGQSGSEAAFVARGRGYGLTLEPGGARLALARPGGGTDHVRLSVVGADPHAGVSAEAPLTGRVNHFVGDPSRWRAGIPTYARVTTTGVRPGVDMVWYGDQSGLEYDFVVAPGADPTAIAVAFDGVERLSLDDSGALVLETGAGRLLQHPPVVYQELDGRRRPVDAAYMLDGEQVRFALGAYDTALPLVIDPVLAYSTYLGGSGIDSGEGIAVDAAGNAVVVGYTASTNFPTANPRQGTHGGGGLDAFVTKLNANGSALVHSTYLGGEGADGASGVALDAGGNAYVVGSTGSPDFPTLSPVRATLSGFEDAFVTKLNPSGILAYSTYLGGGSSDQGEGIAVDGTGSAYLTGATFSADFPTVNAFDATPAGDFDAFAAKLTPAGSALAYSSYLGGSGSDRGLSLAVDAGGSATVTGYTLSAGFPVANAAQPLAAGSTDGFVTKLNGAGSALIYSTFLGGGREDEGRDIAVDGAGNAYVTGMTESANFPTLNAFDATRGGPEDAFVTKLTPAGARVYSTFLGGGLFTGNDEGGGDQGFGIAVDAEGRASVTGLTESSNFPLVDPVQATPASFQDAFLSRLNASGSALELSTYLGGNGVDEGHDVAVRAGNTYVTGSTRSPDPTLGPVEFPTTPGAFQTDQAGTAESAFVTKIGSPSEGAPPPADFDGDGDTDFAVFRPSTGFWFVNGGPVAQFGANGDIPVPGDYDGDGDTDFAVFRPSTGFWFVNGGPAVHFGANGDIPVPGDYDGDGDTDFAVFRPSTGFWFVNGGPTVRFGTSGDVPLPLPSAVRLTFFP